MTRSLEQIPRDHQTPILPRQEPSVGKLESKWYLKRPNREAKFMGSSVLLLFNLHLNNESEDSVSLSVMSYSLDPMDCSLPGSSVHGILWARILEWGAIPFSRGSSQPRDWAQISGIEGRILYCLSDQGSPLFTVW